MSCTNSVASEDFADFIAPYFTTPEEFIRSQGTDCIDFVNFYTGGRLCSALHGDTFYLYFLYIFGSSEAI